MADQFSIEAKLKITGVDVKGDLNAGTLKFKVDTSALKKLVSDAGIAAKKVKAKFDRIKLKKLKIEVNKNSLRSVESQIRRAVQNAVKKTKLSLTTSVAGGTRTDPFKAQRLAAGKSAKSLTTLHELTKQVNSGLRSMVKTLSGVTGQRGPAAKGALPFPPGARFVDVGGLGGAGGGRGPGPGPGAAPGGPGRGGGGVRQAAGAMGALTTETQKANKEVLTLTDLTEQVGRKAAAFRGVAIAINTVVTAAQAAARFIIEFNDSLIELNKILQVNAGTLQTVGNDLFGLSAKTGVAVDQTIAIAQEFARAGLEGRGYGTVVQLTDRALTGLQGTTLDATQASELFIQVLQQVEAGVRGLGKEVVTTAKLFDVLGKAEDITAAEAIDVQAAFKRSAASIFATGVTIEQATTLISVLQERTKRGGDVVGTALKTLASRISVSTSEATKALNAIGVETIDQQGNLRNLFDILQDTAVAFNGLTEAEQANVAVKAAGIRQVEIFRAAVQDFNRMQEVNTQLVNASGDAARKQAAEQSKLANVLSRLQIAFQQLIKTASEGIIGEAFVGVITTVEKLLTGIAALDKRIGGMVSTFAGVLAIGLGMRILIPMLIGIGKAIGFFIGLQGKSAMAMGGIMKGGQAVAATVAGKMNPALQQTAAATAMATTQMQGLGAATAFAASQAERLAIASRAGAAGALGTAGAAGVAGRAAGNIGRRGVDIVQTGGKAGGAAFLAAQAQKKVGLLGKTAGLAGKAFKSLGKIGLGLAAVFTIAGGAVQSFGQNLRKEGSKIIGGLLDIGGGGLTGAGIGAAIGTLILPGIGTGLGAAIGGLVGAASPVVRTIESFSDGVKDLGKEFLALGIIQKENGEITSDVAEQIDKALRNLEAFGKLETARVKRERRDLFDPKGAEERDKKRAKAEADAIKSLLAGFDPGASLEMQFQTLNQTINKLLVARGAGEDIDVGAPEAQFEASPLLKKVGIETVNEIEAALIRAGEEFNILPGKVKEIVSRNLQRIAEQRIDPETAVGKERIAEQKRVIEEQVKQFTELLGEVIPTSVAEVNIGGLLKVGIPIGEANEELAGLNEAIENIARGKGGKAAREFVDNIIKQVQVGDIVIPGAGGERFTGEKGVEIINRFVRQAERLLAERQTIGVTGPGQAIPAILKEFRALFREQAAAEVSRRRVAAGVGITQEIRDILSALRTEFPIKNLGKFIATPVSKLELLLRNFLAEFARATSKLADAQLRATTPQQELTQALAENADANLEALQRRIALEKADAIQAARAKFQETIGGAGQRLFATPEQLSASLLTPENLETLEEAQRRLDELGQTEVGLLFKQLKEDLVELQKEPDKNADAIRKLNDRLQRLGLTAQGIEIKKLTADIEALNKGAKVREKLKKLGISLEQLFAQASALEVDPETGKSRIAEVFGVTEEEAKKLAELFKTNTGKAAAAVFEAIGQASRDAVAEATKDPDKLRQFLIDALGPQADLIKGFSDKELKDLVETAGELNLNFVKLDTEGFEGIIDRNAKVLAGLKARIAEEERVLSVDKQRRAAAAMASRAFAEELTGIRRLVAEREIETQVLDGDIAAHKKLLATLDEEEAKVRKITETEENSASIKERLTDIERKRTGVIIKMEEDLAKQRTNSVRDTLQVTKLAADEAKKAASAERGRISALADINALLSVDERQMSKFNAELATVGANFRAAQAALAAEAQAIRARFQEGAKRVEEDPRLSEEQKVAAVTQLMKEREAGLANIRTRGEGIALDTAKAEAQIASKRREAIKQLTTELLGNQQQQVDAQKAVIEATKGVAEAFETYLQAVDGAIMATTRYNLGLEMASIAATRVTGGFTGMTEEIGVVQDTFRDAERLARDMGASEKTLVAIRRESISQQLAMFNQLLADQTQAARSFFTSSAQDQAALFQGIREAQGVAALLGGSFEEFKKKGDNAINDLGAQILALPQESRQRIAEAIDILRTTGGTVGGFTADELQTALDEAIFGRPEEDGLQVDPIIQVQEKIAALTEEQAQLATEELIASQEQVVAAKEQLEVAQAAKDLAEIQLERIKEEGEKLRGKLGDLQGQLHTTLLQQDQTARTGFQSVTSAVARAANDVVTKLPDAFSVKVAEAFRQVMTTGGITVPRGPGGVPLSDSRQTPRDRGREDADMQREFGRNRARAQQQFSQGGNGVIIPVTASAGATTGRDSNNPNDPGAAQTNRTLNDILSQLQDLNTTSDASLEATEAIVDNTGTTVGTAAAVIGGTGQPEITINVEGTSTVTVTGFEAGVTRIAQALTETFGGFATEEEARQIANEVLENIRTELLRRGIITRTTL